MTYKETLTELLVQNGTIEQYRELIDRLIESYKGDPENSDVPGNIWDEMGQEFKSLGIDDLIELFLPAYSAVYSQEELVELTEFYQSTMGIKMRDRAKALALEIAPASHEWGKKITQRFIKKLEDKDII